MASLMDKVISGLANRTRPAQMDVPKPAPPSVMQATVREPVVTPSNSVRDAHMPNRVEGVAMGESVDMSPKVSSPEMPRAISPEAELQRESRPQSKQVSVKFDLLMAAGMITPNVPRSQIAEEFRVLKRPLIANALGKGTQRIHNGNLIMVTASVFGEGTSFTAINLAMSMATEMDTTVMLVDANVGRPSVLRTLGLPSSPGLLDVLAKGSVDISEVLLRTNVGKLTVLPSGSMNQRATELLASDAMFRLLEDMASRYPDRLIVFDAPPLLQTTESRVLTTSMGQIVVVVKAGETRQSVVKQALKTIDHCPVKMLALNKVQGQGPASGSFRLGYQHSRMA